MTTSSLGDGPADLSGAASAERAVPAPRTVRPDDDVLIRDVAGDAAREAADDAGPVLDVLLVGSSGGHLAQLAALDAWSCRHDRHWVCFDTPDAVSILAGEDVTWAYHPTTRNVLNLARNVGLAWRLLRRRRPDVVLSTGAGVALPFFVVARLLGVPTVFLEVYDRLDTPTLTGRLVRPFASRMLVQWEEQRGLYKGAEVVGCVL